MLLADGHSDDALGKSDALRESTARTLNALVKMAFMSGFCVALSTVKSHTQRRPPFLSSRSALSMASSQLGIMVMEYEKVTTSTVPALGSPGSLGSVASPQITFTSPSSHPWPATRFLAIFTSDGVRSTWRCAGAPAYTREIQTEAEERSATRHHRSIYSRLLHARQRGGRMDRMRGSERWGSRCTGEAWTHSAGRRRPACSARLPRRPISCCAKVCSDCTRRLTRAAYPPPAGDPPPPRAPVGPHALRRTR